MAITNKFHDLTGQRFTRLTAQWPAGRGNKQVYWLCLCDCGNLKVMPSAALRGGHLRSCGCWNAENRRRMIEGFTKHGHARLNALTREYRIWRGMIQRCTNPHVMAWKHYGGRGIKICDRWLDSFETFLADMGPCPSSGHSIDRWPNNDGNYEPGNCRWATRKQQAEVFVGKPKSESTRRKLSEALKGNQNWKGTSHGRSR